MYLFSCPEISLSFIILNTVQMLIQRFLSSAQTCTSLFLSNCLLDICTWMSNWYLQLQFSSVAQLCPTLCDPMNRSTPGLPVHHQLPEFTQTHVHQVSDTIQPPHLLSFPSPPTFYLSQHQGLFKWVSSSHQVAKVLEFQLQHQSFWWTPRTDFF